MAKKGKSVGKKRRKRGAGKGRLSVLEAARAAAVEAADSEAKAGMFARTRSSAASLAPKGSEVRQGTPPGIPQASDVICEVAEPLLEGLAGNDVAGARKALLFACVAWNASVDAGGRIPQALASLTQLLAGVGLPPAVMGFAEHLVRRKGQLFPDDHRTILQTDVELLPSGEMYVTAVASYPPGMWK
jgi:hypothetical protein